MKMPKNVKQMLEIFNEKDMINILMQPIRKNKSAFRLRIHNITSRTNKAYCCDGGLINPVKLNINNETLSKLKKGI